MKLSKETLTKLKYLSEINSNLFISRGNVLKSVNPSRSLMGQTKIAEEFDVDEFGIYDLNEFLGVLSLFEDPELEFSPKFVKITDGKASIKYFSANKEVLVYPTKDVNFPEADIVFDLDANIITSIRKIASVLSATSIIIRGDSENIELQIGDSRNATATSYSSVVGKTDKTFNVILKVDLFKLMPDSYTVSISKKRVSKFESKENLYYLAVESDSSFDF